MPAAGEAAAWDQTEELLVVDEPDDDGAPRGWFSRNVGGLMANVAGTQTLRRDQVDPVMEELKKKLLEKNVALEVAEAITASVADGLVGKSVERFRGAASMIRDALAEAVGRVLTPKRSTDVLREVLACKAKNQGPYSIVFVGVDPRGNRVRLECRRDSSPWNIHVPAAAASRLVCKTIRAANAHAVDDRGQTRRDVQEYARSAPPRRSVRAQASTASASRRVCRKSRTTSRSTASTS